MDPWLWLRWYPPRVTGAATPPQRCGVFSEWPNPMWTTRASSRSCDLDQGEAEVTGDQGGSRGGSGDATMEEDRGGGRNLQRGRMDSTGMFLFTEGIGGG